LNTVEPIRDSALVNEIEAYLKKTNYRNYLMFMCGIYTGLRIGDILRLKIRDVKGKRYINIREEKTNKEKRHFEINPELIKVIKEYTTDRDPDDYLIKSRVGYNKPIDRSTAYRILRDVGDIFEIDNIGTHTLRKTFGYHFYKQTKDIETLKEILNHSSSKVTFRYIGINQESINESIRKLKI